MLHVRHRSWPVIGGPSALSKFGDKRLGSADICGFDRECREEANLDQSWLFGSPERESPQCAGNTHERSSKPCHNFMYDDSAAMSAFSRLAFLAGRLMST